MSGHFQRKRQETVPLLVAHRFAGKLKSGNKKAGMSEDTYQMIQQEAA